MTKDWTGYQRFRPIFARVVDPDKLAWLDHRIASNDVQLWAGDHGAIVTELRRDDDHILYVNTLILGGTDRTELLERLRPEAEHWAASMGCAYSLVEGRTGWRRILPRYGYALAGNALRKEL